MRQFKEIQKRLEELSPIPVNMPKLYLLGDTGAGKSTIVRRLLGTKNFKFPSTLQKRTTVATTEYVISKDLPFRATYIFKSSSQISEFVSEILEIAIENTFTRFSKGDLSVDSIVENLKETPDEKFRLKYILTTEQQTELATEIQQFMPTLDAAVKKLCTDLQSNEEDLGVIVEMAIDEHRGTIDGIKARILGYIKTKVSEVCDGSTPFTDTDYFQHSSDDLEKFVAKAKLFLSSTNDSISPVVEYARLQGNLLADWLPRSSELVLIDGEGIGHDTSEAGQLSARHLDYFHFTDAIALVEECKRPFASGGKSAIEGIVRNGYLEKFYLLFTKLDEVEVGDGEQSSRDDQIREVKKGLVNVKHALRKDGVELDIDPGRVYYLSNMKADQLETDSVQEINKLIGSIKTRFTEEVLQFVVPCYDYEMLSSYLSKSSESFLIRWESMLEAKPWQTVKAFNRRMCWEREEFSDMKPIADFHGEVMKELDHFISNPKSWEESATPSMQKQSLAKVKQEFSNQLLKFARDEILIKYRDDWNKAMLLSQAGSALKRKSQIKQILINVSPDHRNPDASKMKNSIKQKLASAVVACKA